MLAIDDYLSNLHIEEEFLETVFKEEIDSIEELPDNINTAISYIKIDWWFVNLMFDQNNSWWEEIPTEWKSRICFHQMYTIGVFKGKKVIFEAIREERIEDFINYMNKYYPDLDYHLQCFGTGRPKINTPISAEQDKTNKNLFLNITRK